MLKFEGRVALGQGLRSMATVEASDMQTDSWIYTVINHEATILAILGIL